jgi:hypothetical protein
VVAGEVPVTAFELSLRGCPGRRVAAGVGWFTCGALVGVAAPAMAASTRGRHRMWLRDPGGRPLGLGLLMLKVGVREPGALGGVGFDGRMVVKRMWSYTCERKWRRPPPLLSGGSRTWANMASLIPRATLLPSLAR